MTTEDIDMLEATPPSRARILGVVYLLYFATAISGSLLTQGLAVHGDAASTAIHFVAHENLMRGASALGLLSLMLYLVLTAMFYGLFRQTSPELSLLAILFSVGACSIQALGDVFLAPLMLMQATESGQQTALLASACLAMHAQTLHMALVLFGAFDILVGVLIVRSKLVPRIFGVLMVLAGIAWLTYLWPPLANELSRIVQPLGFLAEAVLAIWLVAKSVDEERWRIQTG